MNKRKKILICDDEPHFVKLVKIRLEANNYDVVTLSDSRMVLEAADKERPDVIMLDIVMPDKGGYEVCDDLKKNVNTKKIPVILLTGKDLVPSGISERCRKHKSAGFLIKPVEPEDLLSKIEKVLKEKSSG